MTFVFNEETDVVFQKLLPTFYKYDTQITKREKNVNNMFDLQKPSGYPRMLALNNKSSNA